jgi:hypothetical protein
MNFYTLIQDPDMFMLGIVEQRKALMSRHFAQRHYEGIASVISKLSVSEDEVEHIIKAFSDFLEDDNDRFDSNKFEDACCKKEG